MDSGGYAPSPFENIPEINTETYSKNVFATDKTVKHIIDFKSYLHHVRVFGGTLNILFGQSSLYRICGNSFVTKRVGFLIFSR